jgi:hypothetical protein
MKNNGRTYVNHVNKSSVKETMSDFDLSMERVESLVVLSFGARLYGGRDTFFSFILLFL